VSAGECARWLGELSDALDEAQALICALAASDPWSTEKLDLAARIEAARVQVRSPLLRRRSPAAAEFPPGWTNRSLWNGCELGD
jgi:predicted metal-dependent hydrolase